MNYGYARVSTDDQDTAAQVAALKDAGCTKIFSDKGSGTDADRPELAKLFACLGAGDSVIVWKLDRLSRSLQHILRLLQEIDDRKATFRSIMEPIDTRSSAGRALMQMIGTFAEFETAIIRERTKAGLAHARSQGRHAGRKRKLTGEKINAAIELLREGTLMGAARVLDVSLATLKRALKRRREEVLQQAKEKAGRDAKNTQKTHGKPHAKRTPHTAAVRRSKPPGKRRNTRK